MSRTQPKSSPTDAHARRIAQAIARVDPPPFMMPSIGTAKAPTRNLAAFTGAARHMPPAGQDEPLAIGYLFLLQRAARASTLSHRSRLRGRSQLIADFQADVVAQVEAGNVDGRMLAFVGGALHQSKIPASPELPRRRQGSPSTRTRTDRFRPTSTPLSPAS